MNEKCYVYAITYIITLVEGSKVKGYLVLPYPIPFCKLLTPSFHRSKEVSFVLGNLML